MKLDVIGEILYEDTKTNNLTGSDSGEKAPIFAFEKSKTVLLGHFFGKENKTILLWVGS